MARFEEVAGFILAGGASSRMGREKASLEIGGRSLVLRAADRIKPLVAQDSVIGPLNHFVELPLRVYPDDRPGLGPLGGIATALRVTQHEWNLVVACDLPYLTTRWLEFLIERALERDADALLPESKRGPEPLCAVYRRRAAQPIAAALVRGVRKVTDGLAGLRAEFLPPEASKQFDSRSLLFKNINTPADYEEARAVLEGSQEARKF